MISLSGLRTLVTVVETGGVRSASDRLGRTPSAVSMALKQIEDTLGAPLFEGDRKSRPTAFGQLVIEKARELLDHYDSACAMMSASARHEISHCDVAAVTSFAVVMLAPAIARLKRMAPRAEVKLREINSHAMLDVVADGIVDVAFGRLTVPRPDLEMRPVLVDAFDLVCRHDDPLGGIEGVVPWDAIRRRDFVNNESFGALRPLAPTDPHGGSRFHATSIASLMALVRSGVGITILPRLCRVQATDDLRFLPLEDPGAVRVLGMITRRGRRLSPATERLIAATLDVVAENAAALGYRAIDPEEALEVWPPPGDPG